METIDLAEMVDDATLEGLRLGIVYRLDVHGDTESDDRREQERDRWAEKRRNDEESDVVRKQVENCIGRAVEGVQERFQMEGVMDVERGRVSYLVYRVD